MYTQFEEKGKIFTNVIPKKPIPVTIQTTVHLIHGEIYIRPDERIKDALKPEENFLAVTDAVIYNEQGQLIYRTKFLTVNQANIIWLIPDEDIVEADPE